MRGDEETRVKFKEGKHDKETKGVRKDERTKENKGRSEGKHNDKGKEGEV